MLDAVLSLGIPGRTEAEVLAEMMQLPADVARTELQDFSKRFHLARRIADAQQLAIKRDEIRGARDAVAVAKVLDRARYLMETFNTSPVRSVLLNTWRPRPRPPADRKHRAEPDISCLSIIASERMDTEARLRVVALAFKERRDAWWKCWMSYKRECQASKEQWLDWRISCLMVGPANTHLWPPEPHFPSLPWDVIRVDAESMRRLVREEMERLPPRPAESALLLSRKSAPATTLR